MCKIAFVCDIHLPFDEHASQYAMLDWAVDTVNKENPDLLVVAGDITAAGEGNAFSYFRKALEKVTCGKVILLGNSDVRSGPINKFCNPDVIKAGKRPVYCINTPYDSITDDDKKALSAAPPNAVLVMHHSIKALGQDVKTKSMDFITDWASKRNGLIIHGHQHRAVNYYISKTNVIGLRALDPDKSVGGFPCVTFFKFDGDEYSYYEKHAEPATQNMDDFIPHLGISCFDPGRDIDFAAENGILNIELRVYAPEQYDMIRKKVLLWKQKGGKYLSVHMPSFRSDGNSIAGTEKFDDAVRFIKTLPTDFLTIHAPETRCSEMKGGRWEDFLETIIPRIKRIPPEIKIGFENLHSRPGEDENDRPFGCLPEDMKGWIDAVNDNIGFERTGLVLDVGHAFNNPPFAQKNTLGIWYAQMGKRITAYHLHQVFRSDGKRPNHRAIQDWFGPDISYASFFWAWQTGQINHRPMFLEMLNIKNCRISLESAHNLFFDINILKG